MSVNMNVCIWRYSCKMYHFLGPFKPIGVHLSSCAFAQYLQTESVNYYNFHYLIVTLKKKEQKGGVWNLFDVVIYVEISKRHAPLVPKVEVCAHVHVMLPIRQMVCVLRCFWNRKLLSWWVSMYDFGRDWSFLIQQLVVGIEWSFIFQHFLNAVYCQSLITVLQASQFR